MRLRRENGDFDFIIKNDGTCTIPAKLFPEQLVGQIVVTEGGDAHQTITAVVGASGAATYALVTGNGGHLTYTVATGEVTMGTSEGNTAG